MVIMALDHTRDFFHAGAMSFSPEDLARTTPILFFTRWITHVCAPVFLFTAGIGAFLRLDRPGATKAQLSRFLLTRGAWLILIELTVMRLAFNFSFEMRYPLLLLVLWALGVSMIALAALIYLPRRVLAVASLAVIILHNSLDSVQASQFGAFGGVWNVLHQQGVFVLGGIPVVAGYPVMPWIAVMALGFCVGPIFRLEPHLRQRLLLKWGTLLIVAFVLLRAVNVYGDPAPWSVQPSATYTLLSFLRTTKYPPSLDFLLMTIGPALLALAWFDRRRLEAQQSARRHRSRAVLLLRHAFLGAPRAGRPDGVAALRRRGDSVPSFSRSVDGRFTRLLPTGFRVSALGRLPCLDCHRRGDLSALPMVRGSESAPTGVVVELFVSAKHLVREKCRWR